MLWPELTPEACYKSLSTLNLLLVQQGRIEVELWQAGIPAMVPGN